MKRNRHWIMFPGVLSALLVVTVGVSAVVGTIVLEALAIRFEGGGSLTTMFPGFAYAGALILKVSLLEALLLGAFSFLMKGVPAEDAGENLPDRRPSIPKFAIASVLLPATAGMIGAVVIIVAQTLIATPETSPALYFSRISRIAVVSLLALVGTAKLCAIYSLVRREHPIGVAVIGLVTSLAYLVLFRYWEFYKLGFDQDRWNEI